MSDTVKTVLEGLGIGAIGVVGLILLVAILFVLGTAFTAFVVALAWNWLGLHTVFGAAALSFWKVVGVAVGINVLRSIFSRTTIEPQAAK